MKFLQYQIQFLGYMFIERNVGRVFFYFFYQQKINE